MTAQLEYRTATNEQDAQQLGTIVRQCFGSSIKDWEDYFNSLGAENWRLLRQGERVIAGLALYHMGQWYGGQVVPMAGIAAVGVAPEYRGQGVARELLSRTLEELHRQGVPISALYPATQILYRKVGYEQAGSYCRWELPIASIQGKERDKPIIKLDTDDYSFFERIYNQQASINNGNLARHRAIWENAMPNGKAPANASSPEKTTYLYLVGSQDEPEGYIIFNQHRDKKETIIEIKDWVMLTAAAAKRIWTFIADMRSQVDIIAWRGSPFNPYMLFLPEQTAKIAWMKIWMVRIVDVVLALEKRGYPCGLNAELHLQVQDELIAANNGNFCLKVSQGRGKVSRGGKGDFKIGIRGLASLYTSFLNPDRLQLIHYLEASKDALETATLLFSGSSPWMADFF
jgi:predicted acetyltransferase